MFKPYLKDRHMHAFVLKHKITKNELSERDNNELINLARKTYFIGTDQERPELNPNHPWNLGHYGMITPITPQTDKLTRIFYKHLTETFDNLDLIHPRRLTSKKPIQNECSMMDSTYVYLSKKDMAVSFWHNHAMTGAINMVYYASVPDETATLSIVNHLDWNKTSLEEKVIEIKVQTGDMIIMPAWFDHKPNPPDKSNELRIVFNKTYMSLNRPVIHIDKCDLSIIGDPDIYSDFSPQEALTHDSYNLDWIPW